MASWSVYQKWSGKRTLDWHALYHRIQKVIKYSKRIWNRPNHFYTPLSWDHTSVCSHLWGTVERRMDQKMKIRDTASDLVIHSLIQATNLYWVPAMGLGFMLHRHDPALCEISYQSLHLSGSHAPHLSKGNKSISIIIMRILGRSAGARALHTVIVLYCCPLCNGHVTSSRSLENYVQTLVQGGWGCSAYLSLLAYILASQPRPKWAGRTESSTVPGEASQWTALHFLFSNGLDFTCGSCDGLN